MYPVARSGHCSTACEAAARTRAVAGYRVVPVRTGGGWPSAAGDRAGARAGRRRWSAARRGSPAWRRPGRTAVPGRSRRRQRRPGSALPAESAWEGAGTAPRKRDPVLAWSAASTQLLLDALREAGPDRGCWTWWGPSESPQTSGAVTRHQLQEARRTPTTPRSPWASRRRCRTRQHSTASRSSYPPAAHRRPFLPAIPPGT